MNFIKATVIGPGRFLGKISNRLVAEGDINFVWDKESVKLFEKLIGYGFNLSDRFDERSSLCFDNVPFKF